MPNLDTVDFAQCLVSITYKLLFTLIQQCIVKLMFLKSVSKCYLNYFEIFENFLLGIADHSVEVSGIAKLS